MIDDVLIILSREELELIKKALLSSTVERLGFTDSVNTEKYIKVTAKVIEKCESVDKKEANEEEKQKSELKAV